MSTGFFISFEGGEGSGKTTQINKLAENLTSGGHKVVTTREPGGTPEGEKIRSLLVQRDGGDWDAMAEALMFFAARAMLTEKIIRPMLEEGKVVIVDRFTDSTRVYQGYGRGLDLNIIEDLNKAVLGDLSPDLTFILDIDPQEGLARSERRLASENLGVEQSEDRFERLDVEFHKKLRAGFLEIADVYKERCHVLDATLDVDDLATVIERITNERLG